MAKVYYDSDADLNILKGKKIAIIGYGIQGRGQSLCLRAEELTLLIHGIESTSRRQWHRV